MLSENEPVTFTAVAKAEKVSRWLVYAKGVREYIEQARLRQARQPREDGARKAPADWKAEQQITREDNRRLREEVERFKAALRRSLGQQIDQAGAADLGALVDELTVANQRLEDALAQERSQRGTAGPADRDGGRSRRDADQPAPHDPIGEPATRLVRHGTGRRSPRAAVGPTRREQARPEQGPGCGRWLPRHSRRVGPSPGAGDCVGGQGDGAVAGQGLAVDGYTGVHSDRDRGQDSAYEGGIGA
ncbi:hypothetical protein [Actinacidiphila oryziradicis]|uniref:hypothetical protein n=1 Tax=Actinacidiphila oryziradicis TaxID=2571141 RepID=UPI002AFDDC1F|nr:hypothetical protein [Actinacidiphila oryziradicis]